MALAVLVVIFVPVVLVLVLREGEAARERPVPGLRLEGAPGELTVYLADLKQNKAATAGGARQVTLECLDRGGAVVFSAPQAWPFLETDAGRPWGRTRTRPCRRRPSTHRPLQAQGHGAVAGGAEALAASSRLGRLRAEALHGTGRGRDLR